MMRMRKTERIIYDSLNRLASRTYGSGKSNRSWTTLFKNRLRKLGREQDYEVSGGFHDRAEWLVDLAWVKGQASCSGFKGFFMICEMEWKETDDEHLIDFLKLAVCDAPFRVFVFGCKPCSEEKKFRLFKARTRFTKGKRFMAIAVPNTWSKDLPWAVWTT